MIRKRIFTVALALLCASPVLADAGDGLVSSDSLGLLNSYRFTEGDLTRIENAAMTAGTVLRQSSEGAWVDRKNMLTAASLSLDTPMLDWVGSDGQVRSVSMEENFSSPARKIRISTPIVGVEHFTEDVENQIEQRLDILVNDI